jgi:hypothetical protein
MASYGRPRITAELRRRGWEVNPKRVYWLREDNLLCIRRRKFVVTTDSHDSRKAYPNLARDMILTARDQLWRGDITVSIRHGAPSTRTHDSEMRAFIRADNTRDPKCQSPMAS